METKPAIYTTEFWVVVLTNIGLVAAACTEVLTPRYAAIGAAVANGAYALARGLAKQGVAADPAVGANAKLLPRKKDMKTRH